MRKPLTPEERKARDERWAKKAAAEKARYLSYKAVKAVFNYVDGNTFGGLIGNWDMTLFDADGKRVGAIMCGLGGCKEYAVKHGVPATHWEMTPTALRKMGKSLR
jgi:hypothetical protein